jgi:hypothetical protein
VGSGLRLRRASRWGLYLGAVAVLRLAGIGLAPPDVSASASGDRQVAADAVADPADLEIGWILAGFDLSAWQEATDRCLAAGVRCTSDDVLALDTTRAQLESLAAVLTEVGRGAEVRDAAQDASAALGEVLSSGCAGSVDGVAVDPETIDDWAGSCDGMTADAQRALAAFVEATG